MRRRKNDDSDYGGEGTTGNEDDSGFDDEPTKKRVKEIQEKSLSLFAKSLKRSVWGTFMMASFGLIIYWGHAYVCLLVFVLQTCIFKELVGVRKKLAAERKLPLFRSIQWAWFFTAAFFTWSDGMFNFMRDHPPVTSEVDAVFSLFLEKTPLISLGLYSALLIVSILSLRKGMYRYQITQYTWTLVTCCIVVFQMRAVFTSIYSGLFWFVLPCSLVICNDIAAYFAGVCFKGKLTNRPLLELSPNKTWEGFLGAAIFTLFFAFFFSLGF
jgi:phosphatidate cytidylyltransferase